MNTAVIFDERAVHARERALAKARRVRKKRAVARVRRLERDREQFVVWVKREREAFAAHVTEPERLDLRRCWLRVWNERPSLYGRGEAT